MPEQDTHTSFYKDLGKLIKESRVSKKISQNDLSKKINLSRVSIVNIEQGIQKIQVHALVQIAIHLDLNLEHLKPLLLTDTFNDLEKNFLNRIQKSEIANQNTLRKNLLDIKKHS